MGVSGGGVEGSEGGVEGDWRGVEGSGDESRVSGQLSSDVEWC